VKGSGPNTTKDTAKRFTKAKKEGVKTIRVPKQKKRKPPAPTSGKKRWGGNG